MSWLNKQTFGTHVALSLVAGFVMGVSAEVLADTVYSWTTDGGTVAYTDDEKHVPARYRDRVEVRELEDLKDYYRYTPIDNGAFAEAAEQKAAEGAGTVAPAPGTVVVQRPGLSVISGGTRNGNDGTIIPVDGAGDGEPVVIERRRVKRSDSMATQHETVVRQGDRVISIRRDRPSHRDGTGMVPPVDD